LCVISRGLPEYEVLDTERREVAVTLLRAVGYLGAGLELQTAFIGAGPNIATPEGQIQRKLTYSLALLPHHGNWDEVEVWRQAQEFNNPPRAYTTGMGKNRPAFVSSPVSSSLSLFSVEGRNVVLSALKKADEGEALIVRLYNPSDVPTQAIIRLPFSPASIQLAGLDEQPREAAGAAPVLEPNGKVLIALPPKKIVTLQMDRR
jgi:mannosylglycerate hydrolase